MSEPAQPDPEIRGANFCSPDCGATRAMTNGVADRQRGTLRFVRRCEVKAILKSLLMQALIPAPVTLRTAEAAELRYASPVRPWTGDA